MGLKISMLLVLQFSSNVNLHEAIGYHGEIQAVTFLSNRPGLKKVWPLEILTWESMEKY